MRHLALRALTDVEKIPEGFWIKPGTLRLWPNECFTCETIREGSSEVARAKLSMYLTVHFPRGIDRRRAWARNQIIRAILGCASMWICDDGVVDHQGRDIPIQSREVLDYNALSEALSDWNGVLSDVARVEYLLSSLNVIHLRSRGWSGLTQLDVFSRDWIAIYNSTVRGFLLCSCSCEIRL